jgi:hypothetical protein
MRTDAKTRFRNLHPESVSKSSPIEYFASTTPVEATTFFRDSAAPRRLYPSRILTELAGDAMKRKSRRSTTAGGGLLRR